MSQDPLRFNPSEEPQPPPQPEEKVDQQSLNLEPIIHGLIRAHEQGGVANITMVVTMQNGDRSFDCYGFTDWYALHGFIQMRMSELVSAHEAPFSDDESQDFGEVT